MTKDWRNCVTKRNLENRAFREKGLLQKEREEYQRGKMIAIGDKFRRRRSDETNLPFNLCLENAAAFIMSECSNKGMTKDISAAKVPKFIGHSQILKFYAKAKKCFYCGDDHLKSDCPKYKLVDKKTGIKKPPYIKPPFVNRNINEISSEFHWGKMLLTKLSLTKLMIPTTKWML